jgi:hypothetical protein
VRSELAALEGISDIRTDLKTKVCTFKLTHKKLDLPAKLNELAQGNEHLRRFKIIETMN